MNSLLTPRQKYTPYAIQNVLRTSYLFFLVLSISLFSCIKEANCFPETTNSEAVQLLIEELKAANPNCTCEPYLYQYTWKKQTIYVLAYAGPLCNTIPSYYNAKGEPLGNIGFSYDEFLRQSQFIRNVWACK